ncbi:Metallo-dependent phosphatase [Zalerion maritima]|uniref:Metallo-dependent phosphatase n=1 Tax=Zalerion maritima TaxID=339359 RepID=A0AAD5RXG5_9PEZI|nr:Metallo-dependent phosphatase [Zalerion maritima]
MWFNRQHPLEQITHRKPPSEWDSFLSEPVLYLTRKLWELRNDLPFTPSIPITVVCISDTHNTTPDLPAGDILIHAGDLTENGTYDELVAQISWLDSQPHHHKLVIGGNHDTLLDPESDPPPSSSSPSSEPGTSHEHELSERERRRAAIMWGSVQYLSSSSTNIKVRDRSLNVYGSPRTPRQGKGPYSAFKYDRCDDEKAWKGQIPSGTDILITHGPPKTHLDMNGIGCLALLEETWRRRPGLHVFGHIHYAGGQTEKVAFDGLQHKVEQTILDRGGVGNLIMVVWEWLKGLWRPKVARHILVNAAMIWGNKNEKRRKPIVVQI